MTAPDFTSYTKTHWTCLLYIETLIVDKKGETFRNDPHMNGADWDAVDDFDAHGLLVWGCTGMHPVFSFTDLGWAVAHAIRRAGAQKIDREHWPEIARRAEKVERERCLALLRGDQAAPTFEEVWAAKEAEGYQYGHDALELVRFGWSLARGEQRDQLPSERGPYAIGTMVQRSADGQRGQIIEMERDRVRVQWLSSTGAKGFRTWQARDAFGKRWTLAESGCASRPEAEAGA